MSVITVSNSDSLNTIVDGINNISINIGDVTTLVTGDSDIVSAINNIRTSIENLDDSGEFTAASRSGFSVSNAGGDGSLAYSSATGQFTYTGQTATEARAQITAERTLSISGGVLSIVDSSLENINFRDGSISYNNFDSFTTTEIQNSAGSTIITLRTIAS